MRFQKLLMSAFLGANAGTALAGFTFNLTPNTNPPPKVSGTNCWIQSEAMADGVSQFPVYAELILTGNGSSTVVSWYAWNPIFPNPPMNIGLSCKFASTHFPHGASLQFKIRSVRVDGIWHESSDASLSVYNKGMSYEHDDFGFVTGAFHSWQKLENMNHQVVNQISTPWTKAMLLSDLQQSTAGHIGTHGTAQYVIDTVSAHVWPADIVQARSAAAQNGIPKMNVVLMDACVIGANWDFMYGLLSPQNGVIVNQAAVGFSVPANSAWSNAYGEEFWSSLAKGETAEDARDKLIQSYNSNIMPNVDTAWTRLESYHVPLHGDPYTRLKYVYTGSSTSEPNLWYVGYWGF